MSIRSVSGFTSSHSGDVGSVSKLPAHLSAERQDAINADNIAELVQSHADDLSAEELVEQQLELAAREEMEEESPVLKATALADLTAVVQSGLDLTSFT
ncbi:hypothetical protein E2C01_035832 [Portunus trituberculatus]|uniref:Uncharacterized protein n=1 Tax=Portunus trituberculatus TaxID=210409 RepID=A0A5B7FA86_PORTR|nr:hypothetical protein [Portunus trituberculatus]